MLTQAKRLLPALLPLLFAASPLAAQRPNPNARFGFPAPAKADTASREAYLPSSKSCTSFRFVSIRSSSPSPSARSKSSK